MIILGIDPGSHTTGYAFLKQDHEKIQVLEYGAIKARTNDPLMQRLGHIVAELDSRIQLYHPQMLVMESSFYSENARTALVLGHARGAVMGLASRYNMQFAEFSPKSIKQSCTGTGAASKERVALMMQHHLHLQALPNPLDASDALAVAWTYIYSSNTPSSLKAPAKASVRKSTEIPLHLPGTANALPAHTDIQALLQSARKRKRK